jgi:hypothetical protein
MNIIKTYILAPNFDIPAEGPNAMTLGHIISDPTTPDIALNKSTVAPFPADVFPTSISKPGWTGTICQIRSKKFGIWARFLESIGLGGEISSSRNTDSYFEFESLETKYFNPTDDYVKESMKSEGVHRFIKAGRYKKPVYMITGLKIARGASALGSETSSHGGSGKFGFDGTATGIPVTVGPEVELSSAKTNAVSFTGATGFAFAIRLQEISYTKGLEIVRREFTEGVVLGYDEAEDEQPAEESLKVLGIKPQDAADFEELEITEFMEVEDEESIRCVVVTVQDSDNES